MIDPDAARRHLLAERTPLIRRIVDCADAVAAAWDGERDGSPATDDRAAVRAPLERTLDRAGVPSELATVLQESVAVAGGELPAEPAAAPPYVAVSSTGPVLRATLPDGRFVVRFEVVDVADGRYVRSGTDPEDVVAVELIR